MKKLLTVMVLLMVFASIGCSKKSMSNGLNNGSPDGGSSSVQGDTKQAYTYMSYMYNSGTGASLNNAALSGYEEIEALYPGAIQQMLNSRLKFPVATLAQTKSRSAQTYWYNTAPSDFNTSLSGQDVAKAMENYFNTDAGQTYVINYLNKVINDITAIKTYADSTDSTSYSGSSSSDLQDLTKIGVISAKVYLGCADTNDIIEGVSAVSDLLGFGFGGGSGNSKINQSLQEIKNKLAQIKDMLRDVQTQLVNMENKLNNIINKLDALSTVVNGIAIDQAHADVKNARVEIDTIFQRINNMSSYTEDEKRQYLYSRFIQGTNDYELILNRAYDAAKTTHDKIKSSDTSEKLFGSIAVTGLTQKWLNAAANLDSHGSFDKDMTIDPAYNKFQKPLYYMVPLEDLALLKRLSLSRIGLFARLFSGQELIQKRIGVIQDDAKKLKELKQSLQAAVTSFNADVVKQKQLSVNYSPYYFKDNNRNLETWGDVTGFAEVSFPFLTTQDSSVQDYLKNSGYWNSAENKALFIDSMGGAIFNSTFGLTRYSAVNYFIKNVNTEYVEFFVTAAAILADWEIQLRAHCLAAGVSYDSL